MVTRTWIGGGNNRADNSKDWSPNGVPQPGDSLFVSPGDHTSFTMNVTGDIDPLTINGGANLTTNLSHQAHMGAGLVSATATFNMSQSSTLDLAVVQGAATVNMAGDNTLGLFVSNGVPNSAAATVNLKHNAVWTGHLSSQAEGNTITVNGGADTVFKNDNTRSFVGGGSFAKIDANVLGIGAFDVAGRLEFMQAVGVGQTIDEDGLVQIDRPDLFAGSIILDDFSPPTGLVAEIDLIGLTNADSYTFKNDLLSIFSGGKVIDALRLHDSTPNGFVVEQTSGSVSVVAISDPNNPPIGLPIHMG